LKKAENFLTKTRAKYKIDNISAVPEAIKKLWASKKIFKKTK